MCHTVCDIGYFRLKILARNRKRRNRFISGFEEKEKSFGKEKWRLDLDSDKTKCKLFEITNFYRTGDCFFRRQFQCSGMFQCTKVEFPTDVVKI